MIRSVSALGVLCLAVAPSLGDPVEYTFDIISPDTDIGLSIQGSGSTIMSVNGQLTATIYQSDGHIGSSDTLLLTDMGLVNTERGVIDDFIPGALTANIPYATMWLLGFIEDANDPAHIGEGGTFTAHAGAYVSLTLKLTGLFTTTLSTGVMSEGPLEIDGTITTSGETSDTIAMTIDFSFTSIPVVWTQLSTTFYVDLDVHVEATAHHAPDPTLGGMIVLGLGGAGTWLRRRRRA